MKTIRTLHLERYGPMEDDDIPEHLFTFDDKILIWANMVPPGQHFFYFAKEKNEIFLSPRFPVVRFKQTNIYFNRIVVKPRIEEMNYTVHTAKARAEEEDIFNKDRSVFRNYIEDT